MKSQKIKIFLSIVILIFVFILGFIIGKYDIFITGRVVDNNNVEILPPNFLNEDDILVYKDKIILKINDAKISNYKSQSMIPFLGEGANGIVIKPKNEEEINVGEIVTFKRGEDLIVHRVIEKGIDEGGVYFIIKGDNNNIDDGKIRFSQIEHKLVGIIY